MNCENVQCALYTVAVFVGSSLGRKAYNLDQNRMRTDLQGRLGLSSVYMLLILQYWNKKKSKGLKIISGSQQTRTFWLKNPCHVILLSAAHLGHVKTLNNVCILHYCSQNAVSMWQSLAEIVDETRVARLPLCLGLSVLSTLLKIKNSLRCSVSHMYWQAVADRRNNVPDDARPIDCLSPRRLHIQLLPRPGVTYQRYAKRKILL